MSAKATKSLTHQERRERRRMAAQAMGQRKKMAWVCDKYEMTPAQVRNACIEFGVELPDGRLKEVREGK